MGLSVPFATDGVERNGVARIALRGELDLVTAPKLIECLTSVEGNGVTGVILDLRELTFIDSTGIHTLVKAYERAQGNGHRFAMVGLQPAARRILEITGTEFLMDDVGSVELLARFTTERSRAPRSDDKVNADV
jgi:anti-sigma B factor antagonist